MKKMTDFSYKFGLRLRAYPSRNQKQVIFLNARASNYVYNRCVAIDQELYELNQVKIYSKPVQDRMNYLKSIRNNFRQIANMAPFLSAKEIDSMAGANAIANYNKAWKQYHAIPNSSIPVFKKRADHHSYQTNSHYSNGKVTGSYFVDESHIILPAVGRIRVKGERGYVHRLLTNTERLGTFTVALEPDGSCYISVQLASDRPFIKVYPRADHQIGIDVNVKNLLATSDGTVIDNPKYLYRSAEKLKKAQIKLSRKKESAKKRCPEGMKLQEYLSSCSGYQEQRKKVTHIHQHVAQQRMNYLHEVSSSLVKNHDVIVREDLRVKNMGRNHKLAKAIHDVSWGELFQQLDYKCDMHGRMMIKVRPHMTTQTCNVCGYELPEDNRLTLNDRKWICPHCHTLLDRDINSAKNILMRGFTE